VEDIVSTPKRTSVEIQREEEWFVARDKETGVSSQGRTRSEALGNLAEALKLHEEGVPDDVEAGVPETPWFS